MGSATLQISDEAALANFGITIGNCVPRYAIEVISSQPNVTLLGGTSCLPPSKGGGPNPGTLVDAYHLSWPGTRPSDRNGYFIVVQVT